MYSLLVSLDIYNEKKKNIISNDMITNSLQNINVYTQYLHIIHIHNATIWVNVKQQPVLMPCTGEGVTLL